MPAGPAITIRTADLRDGETLSRFASDTFHLGCPADTDPVHLDAFISTELTPERFRQFIGTNGVYIFITEVDARIAGFLMLVSPSPHPQVAARNPIELRKLYVDPRHHGRGIANALMQSALAVIDQPAHDTAWLSVFSGNARAISFYRRWGFAIIGAQDFLVGSDRQKDFVMRRDRPQGEQ